MSLTSPQRALAGAAFLALALTVVLRVVPFGDWLAYPLLLFDTFTHEMGHGLAALAVGGTLREVEIFSGGGGVARSSYPAALGPWVAIGGLVGPALAAAGLFLFAGRPRWARIGLLLWSACTAQGLALFVKSPLAWSMVGALCLAFLWAAKRGGTVAQATLLFVAIKLASNVFSRSGYLFETQPVDVGNGVPIPSDVSHVVAQWGGHEYLWGALILSFSVLVLGGGIAWVLFAAGVFRRARVTTTM